MKATVQPRTFLQLVSDLQLLSGTSQAAQTTVAGATGEWQRMVNWVAQSYLELQMSRDDWDWMEREVTFDTIAQQQIYDPNPTSAYAVNFTVDGVTTLGLPDFRRWKINNAEGDCSFRLYLASAGVRNETYLDASLNYKQFRDNYIFGARRITYARPISIVSDPQQRLLLGLAPDQDYTVTGIYYRDPVLLAADGDIPALPARYHPLIPYLALEKYAIYEAAPEVLEQARAGQDIYKHAIDDGQLEDFQFPDPLA